MDKQIAALEEKLFTLGALHETLIDVIRREYAGRP